MDNRPLAAAWATARARPAEFQGPHIAWRSARDEANLAYAAWCDGGEASPEAYAVFVAAADREEAAAHTLARYARAS